MHVVCCATHFSLTYDLQQDSLALQQKRKCDLGPCSYIESFTDPGGLIGLETLSTQGLHDINHAGRFCWLMRYHPDLER